MISLSGDNLTLIGSIRNDIILWGGGLIGLALVYLAFLKILSIVREHDSLTEYSGKIRYEIGYRSGQYKYRGFPGHKEDFDREKDD